MYKNVLLAAVSAILGVIIGYLVREDIDLLVEQVNEPVVLSTDVTLMSAAGDTLFLPVGTLLLLEETYQEEAYLSIRVVTSRSDVFSGVVDGREATYYFD